MEFPELPRSCVLFALKFLDITEIHYLGNLHHPNLVKLIGYCFKEDEVLLVHEFMLEGSLDDHLFTSMC